MRKRLASLSWRYGLMRAADHDRWTAPGEWEAVLDAFAGGGLDAVCLMFPAISRRAIQGRLARRGVRTGTVRPWKTHEERQLEELWRAGKPPRVIAAELGTGRTPAAVRWHATHLLRLPTPAPRRKNRRWSPGQKKILERSLDALVDNLAERLGQPQLSVASRLRRAIDTRKQRVERQESVGRYVS